MKNKKYLTTFLALLLCSCMIRVADLRLNGPFYGEATSGGCCIHFSIINLGQKTAQNAHILLELRNTTDDSWITEHRMYLGDIAPGEIRKYQLELTGIAWGANIGFRESFKWD